MEYTKRKFLLELENYFTNFPDYTTGEVLYSLIRNIKDKKELLTLSNEEINILLQKTQMYETQN